MKKSIKILILLLLLFIAIPTIYVEANKMIYKNRVMEYLVAEKGYNKEEIKEIKGVWGKKLPPFYTTVIFKDEPSIMYSYFAHNDIIQFEYRSLNNESNIKSSDLKHYEPY